MKLNGSINSSQTIINVSELDIFNLSNNILVDYELMTILSINGSGFNVLRGVKGTNAVSHDDQTPINDAGSFRNNNEPLGLRDSLGNKVLVGSSLAIDSTNTLNAMTGGGDLSSSGSYSNPSWLTSISGSKVSGDISGSAAGLTADIPESRVTNLVSNLATKAPLALSLVTDVDAATVTFDLSSSLLHEVVLGGNRTLALSNVVTGYRFVIILKQDGTGGRSVTWFSGIIWSGFVPSLNLSPNKYDVFEFIAIGTGVYIGRVIQSEVYNRPCMLG